MGHLNSVSDPGEGNLTAENKKNKMPKGVPGRGGMLMLQIDRCIRLGLTDCHTFVSDVFRFFKCLPFHNLLETSS